MKYKIAVIDDKPHIAEAVAKAIRENLTELQVTVDEYSDIQKLIDALDRIEYDLLLSDICMPNSKDGEGLVKLLDDRRRNGRPGAKRLQVRLLSIESGASKVIHKLATEERRSWLRYRTPNYDKKAFYQFDLPDMVREALLGESVAQGPSLSVPQAQGQTLSRESKRRPASAPNLKAASLSKRTAKTYYFPNPLVKAYQEDNLAILVGSGLSSAKDVVGSFPAWNDIPRRLLKVIADNGTPKADDIERLRKDFDAKYTPTTYVSLEDRLADFDVLREKLGKDYQDALNQIFRPHNAHPGDAHKALIEVEPRLILTTNYDWLIELADGKREYTPYVWNDAEKVLVDLKAKRKALFKIHGTAELAQTVVLTRREYDEAKKNTRYQQSLRHIFQQMTVLFVGFGMDDPYDIEPLLEATASDLGSASQTHYTLTRNPDTKRRNDLQRRYVETIPYQEHAEIPHILRALRAKKT